MGGIQSALGCGRRKPKVAHSSFFELECKDRDGNEVRMDKFKDNVILVMNVASK